LREGVRGRGAYIRGRWLYAPLPLTPFLKGRGRIFLRRPLNLLRMGSIPATVALLAMTEASMIPVRVAMLS
jgi:hypothetical protein